MLAKFFLVDLHYDKIYFKKYKSMRMEKTLTIRKLFFIVLLLGIFNQLVGVPAYNKPIEYKQPDGTTLTIQLQGDEFVHWAETLDGFTVLQNENGFYVYAYSEGNELKLSSVVAHNQNSRSPQEFTFIKNLQKGLRFSKKQINNALT